MLALDNLLSQVWSVACYVDSVCPNCNEKAVMTIYITAKSVRVDCKNPKCNKVYFYRRVNLGSRE